MWIKKIIFLSLCLFFVETLFSQSIDVDIMSEEKITWQNIAYEILHLYVSTYPNDYTDKTIIKEISNYLIVLKKIEDVNLNSMVLLNETQFNEEINLVYSGGGHPIFEWWNNSCDWHSLQYTNNLYIIKGKGYNSIIYRISFIK